MPCFLCGLNDDVVIEKHHLIPNFIAEVFTDLKGKGGTVALCANCHRRVHYLLEGIREVFEERVRPLVEQASPLRGLRAQEGEAQAPSVP